MWMGNDHWQGGNTWDFPECWWKRECWQKPHCSFSYSRTLWRDFLKDHRSLGKGRMSASAVLKSLQNTISVLLGRQTGVCHCKPSRSVISRNPTWKPGKIWQDKGVCHWTGSGSSGPRTTQHMYVASEPSDEGGLTASVQLLQNRKNCRTKVTLSPLETELELNRSLPLSSPLLMGFQCSSGGKNMKNSYLLWSSW